MPDSPARADAFEFHRRTALRVWHVGVPDLGQAQVVDAAVKKQNLGVSFSQLMEDVGYTPEQIARMETARAADALLTDAAQPSVPAAH